MRDVLANLFGKAENALAKVEENSDTWLDKIVGVISSLESAVGKLAGAAEKVAGWFGGTAFAEKARSADEEASRSQVAQVEGGSYFHTNGWSEEERRDLIATHNSLNSTTGFMNALALSLDLPEVAAAGDGNDGFYGLLQKRFKTPDKLSPQETDAINAVIQKMIDGAVAHAETEKKNILGMKVSVRDFTPEEAAAMLQQLNGTDIYKQVASGNREEAIGIIEQAIERAFSKGVSVTAE